MRPSAPGGGLGAHTTLVDELDARHRGSIALAGSELEDPRVTAGALEETRRHIAEEMTDYLFSRQNLERAAARSKIGSTPQGDEALDERPYLLRLG